MPSTIPYDPSLVLGSVINDKEIDNVVKIAAEQAKVDAAQESLSYLLTSRRSLKMTRTEIASLEGLDPKDLKLALDDFDNELKELDRAVLAAAKTYTTAKLKSEPIIREARGKRRDVHVEYESPVDYTQTELKSMPLAADSMNMEVQYFAKQGAAEAAVTHADTVSSFVAGQTSFMGMKASGQMSHAAQRQAHAQASRSGFVGTLVISVTCTHKNATILAPFIMNVDKAIKTWNGIFPAAADRIDPMKISPANLRKLAMGDNTPASSTGTDSSTQVNGTTPKATTTEKKFSIISGTTFGSSFVGMVHVFKQSQTDVSENLSAVADSLQSQMEAAGWFEGNSGGFGVNNSIADGVKSLLSAQNQGSHVTLVCMGTIPSVVANSLKMGVQTFANFDPQSSMQQIATIHNATATDQDSVRKVADAARTGQQMISMKSGEIKAALSGLAESDVSSNKVLDINSLMTALQDYVEKAADGKAGVPINYYLKDITKDMLAQMWINKYLPGQYTAIMSDDSKSGNKKTVPDKVEVDKVPDKKDPDPNKVEGGKGKVPDQNNDESGQPDG